MSIHDASDEQPCIDEDGITLYRGDVLDVLSSLRSESVDCVVTSPPYWSLRNYSGEQGRNWGGDPACQHEWGETHIRKEGGGAYTGSRRWQHLAVEAQETGVPVRDIEPGAWGHPEIAAGNTCRLCGAWRGAYGLEPTHLLYVEHTVEVLRAVWRVLKPSGVVWWDIGDSYSGSGRGIGDTKTTNRGNTASRDMHDARVEAGAIGRSWVAPPPGLKAKDLCLIPQRVAIALQDDGWYVRCDVVWSKPNPMPESVTDRPTKSHEYVWLLSKSARYWWDADAVREPLAPSSVQRINQPTFDQQAGGEKDYAHGTNSNRSARQSLVNLKKRADKQRGHGRRHAGFNDRWDNMPRDEQMAGGANIRSVWTMATQPSPLPHFASFPEELPVRCIKASCPPDGIVLDPFAGTGTTLKVARDLGRKAIGIEVSAEYVELAVKRLRYGVRGVMATQRGQLTLETLTDEQRKGLVSR